jgi:hypothetical protein
MTVCSTAQTITEIAPEKPERDVFAREQGALWVRSRGARLEANHELLSAALDQQGPWRGRAPSLEVWTREFFLERNARLAE